MTRKCKSSYLKSSKFVCPIFCNISYFLCFSILHICCKGCASTKRRHSKSSRQAHPLLHVELCDVCETHSGRPPFLLTLRFEAKAAARLGQSQNSRGQVGEDACAHTHVLTSALFARRISYAIHASAVIGMSKTFLLDLRLGKIKSPGLSCNP